MSSELDELLSAARPATAVPETIAALSTGYAKRHGRQRRLRRWLAASTAGLGLGVLGVSAAGATSPHYEQPQWVADVTRPAVVQTGQACTVEFWFIPNSDQVKKDKNLTLSTDAVQKAMRVLQSIDFTSGKVLAGIVATDAYAQQQSFAASYQEISSSWAAELSAQAAAAAAAAAAQPDVASLATAAADAAFNAANFSPLDADLYSYAAGARGFAVQQFQAAGIDTSRVNLVDGSSTITVDCGNGHKAVLSVGP